VRDSLRELLDAARELQSTYYDKDESLLYRLSNGCMANLAQAMNLEWKMVGDESPKKERERLMGLVDAFQYILSILSQSDLKSEELSNLLIARRRMVADLHDTFNSLVPFLDNITNQTKIAVVDVDNVLYPYDFIWESFYDAQKSLMHPYVPSRDECKHYYRSSGMKAKIPPIKGAFELLTTLKERGYTIVLLSAREVNLYPEVYVDTIDFLKTYKLSYDFLLFKKEKKGGIFIDRILKLTDMFIDDRMEQMLFVESYGIKNRILINEISPPVISEDIIRIPTVVALLELLKKS
jgi:hypothetical protein